MKFALIKIAVAAVVAALTVTLEILSSIRWHQTTG